MGHRIGSGMVGRIGAGGVERVSSGVQRRASGGCVERVSRGVQRRASGGRRGRSIVLAWVAWVVLVAACGDAGGGADGDDDGGAACGEALLFSGQPGFAALTDIAEAPDGAFVVVGTSGGRGIVARIAGTALDPAFGTGGIAMLDDGIAADAVALLADGGVIVAGGRMRAPNSKLRDSTVIVRFSAAGVFERMIVDDTEQRGDVKEMIVDEQGRFVLLEDNVLRYLPEGTLDAAFGTGGVASTQTLSSNLVRDADGSYVIGGQIARHIALERLSADGAPVTAFGTAGVAEGDPTLIVADEVGLALAPDGGLVAAAAVARDGLGRILLGLARFRADGTLDPAFGDAGIAVHDRNATSLLVQAAAFDASGDILLAGGEASAGSQTGARLYRVAADGAFDPRDILAPHGAGAPSRLEALTVRADGRIGAAGASDFDFLFSCF